jgi:hypothetical protein
LNGLVLMGDGKGNFISQSIRESGIYIPGNGKALVKLKGTDNRYLIAAGQNRGPLKIFELRRKVDFLNLSAGDISAELTYNNGTTRRLEFHHGSSFLSQSSRFINIDESMQSVIIYDYKGQSRKTEFHENKKYNVQSQYIK